MSDDDDIIIRRKVAQALRAANAPVGLKRWHVAAAMVAAFLLAAWIF